MKNKSSVVSHVKCAVPNRSETTSLHIFFSKAAADFPQKKSLTNSLNPT
jgi:hypothetical protein